MLSHFNRGQKTTPTLDATENCGSGLLTAIQHGTMVSLNLCLSVSICGECISHLSLFVQLFCLPLPRDWRLFPPLRDLFCGRFPRPPGLPLDRLPEPRPICMGLALMVGSGS